MMDILDPPLINIDGRIYCKYGMKNSQLPPQEEIKQFSVDTWNDEPTCDTKIVSISPNERSEVSLNIPDAFYKYIIGSRGDTKRRLEQETGARIKIPERGHAGKILITGKDSASVASAKNRIELLVSSKRWKQPFTHFISIPMNIEQIQLGLKEFEALVLEEYSSAKVDKSLFQNASKLHLTICTLVLLNEEEEKTAIDHFQNNISDILADVLGDAPLDINVQGLEYMNDDPGAVDVLYAKVQCVDGSDRLQVLANRIAESFIEAGLAERQYDRVKLHCTLMNTTFRRKLSPSETNGKSRLSFDASQILTKYGNFDFGRASIREIHLSQRKNLASNGYYACSEKLTI